MDSLTINDLLARLEKIDSDPIGAGLARNWHRNPDGPEAAARIRELEAGLSASVGYLLNAKIDLETGATKATAIRTIEGGIARARALLGERGE